MKDREKIYKKQNGKCDICGIELHIDKEMCNDSCYLQIDHILPQSDNKYVPFEYKRGLCKPCNSKRGNVCGKRNIDVIKNKLNEVEKSFNAYLLRVDDDLRYMLLTEEEANEIKIEVSQKLQSIANIYKSSVYGSSHFSVD